jgi:hypothetical protein
MHQPHKSALWKSQRVRYCGVQSLFPKSDKVCGLPPPLSLRETVPLPNIRNQVTVIEQETPPRKLLPQVFVSVKGPDMLTERSMGVFPRFVKVVDLGGVHTQCSRYPQGPQANPR